VWVEEQNLLLMFFHHSNGLIAKTEKKNQKGEEGRRGESK
jgi:hypothetical protein